MSNRDEKLRVPREVEFIDDPLQPGVVQIIHQHSSDHLVIPDIGHQQWSQLMARYQSVRAPDIARGVSGCARYLGLSAEELLDLVAGQTVLDLGSGRSRFAAEVYLHEIVSPPSTPTVIHSINSRYAIPHYDSLAFDREGPLPDLYLHAPSHIRRLSAQFPVTYTLADVNAAWNMARQGFMGLDWNHLETIPDSFYDHVLSIWAFPFHSEQMVSPYDQQSWITGIQNRTVVQELVRITKPGGEIRLTCNMQFVLGQENLQEFLVNVGRFFADLGCDFQFLDSVSPQNSVLELPHLSKDMVFKIIKR